VVQAGLNPGHIVHAAIEAHRELRQGTMHYHLNSRTKMGPVVLTGDIAFKRGTVLTYSQEDLSYGKHTSRIYQIRNNRAIAYDNYSDEVIQRTASRAVSPPEKLSSAFGQVPDPVSAVGNPAWVAHFLGSLPLNRFKGIRSAQGIVLKRPGQKAGDYTKITFNSQNLITGVSAVAGSNTFSWSLNYYAGSNQPSTLAIPDGGTPVRAFHPHLPMPKYADAKARALALKVLRAARSLKPSEILVQRGTNKTAVFWDNGKIRQNGSRNSWAYDGRNLSLAIGNSYYKGKASHSDTLNYLASLTNGEEMWSRSFLLRTNPLDDYFEPNGVVRIVGPISVQGVPSTILEIKGPITRSSLIVKNSSYLVENASTDTLGQRDKVLHHEEASFKYLPLPNPSPEFFQIPKPPHSKTKSLPKSAIHIGRFAEYKTVR
jgi:hypothetical protein